jgi:sialate O-acetylesterase
LNLPYEPAWTKELTEAKPALTTELPKNPTTQQRAATRPTAARPHNGSAVLYNGMINPLVGFAMRGVIWYQGESNAPHAEKYHDVLGAMIKSWRDAWGEGDFPFLIVQLANYKTNGGDWPGVREAQAQMVSDVPNTGLAVTIDIGESKDIHPKNKAEVGRRLALAALKVAYGQDVVFSGPVVKSLQIDGNKAIVTFDNAKGLMSKGDKLEGFEIAGEDGKFVEANATIDGEKVIVSADSVAAPKAVRYAWADDPKATLYNGVDLPAVPFRTSSK